MTARAGRSTALRRRATLHPAGTECSSPCIRQVLPAASGRVTSAPSVRKHTWSPDVAVNVVGASRVATTRPSFPDVLPATATFVPFTLTGATVKPRLSHWFPVIATVSTYVGVDGV